MCQGRAHFQQTEDGRVWCVSVRQLVLPYQEHTRTWWRGLSYFQISGFVQPVVFIVYRSIFTGTGATWKQCNHRALAAGRLMETARTATRASFVPGLSQIWSSYGLMSLHCCTRSETWWTRSCLNSVLWLTLLNLTPEVTSIPVIVSI